MRTARVLRLVTAMSRARLSLWLLIASSCLAASPSLSQTLSDRDVALIDGFAALYFDLEEGRASQAGRNPVTKSRTNDAILFRDNSHRYRSDSEHVQHLFTFKLPRPCVIAVEQDTRDVSRQRRTQTSHVFDLGKHRTLGIVMLKGTSSMAELKGDKVVCTADRMSCSDERLRMVRFRGAPEGDAREAEAYVARMKSAVDVIRKLCPGQSS
jgi:hypothetical protein